MSWREWWAKYWRLPVGAAVVTATAVIHLVIEFEFADKGTVASAGQLQPPIHASAIPKIYLYRPFITLAMLGLVLIVLRAWRGKARNIPLARKWAWALPFVALLDVAGHFHELVYKAETARIPQLMDGLFTCPALVISSLVFLYMLRDRPPDGPQRPKQRDE